MPFMESTLSSISTGMYHAIHGSHDHMSQEPEQKIVL